MSRDYKFVLEGLTLKLSHRDSLKSNRIVLRPFRAERTVAARKMIQLTNGHLLVQGSQGQIYINSRRIRRGWSGSEEKIRPGRNGLAIAKGLLEFGLIDQAQLDEYRKMCDDGTKKRALHHAADNIMDNAQALGIKFNKAQMKIIESHRS